MIFKRLGGITLFLLYVTLFMLAGVIILVIGVPLWILTGYILDLWAPLTDKFLDIHEKYFEDDN